MFKFDIESAELGLEFYVPLTCSISGGGSSSKQKSQNSSQSGTKWNQPFMEDLEKNSPSINYYNPDYSLGPTGGKASVATGENGKPLFNIGIPQFQGLEDMDYQKLEKGLYDRQLQNTDPAYQKARAQTREELSQSGTLNSPVAYSSGGALDNLTQSYLAENQKAATDASNKTIELKQQEFARKTGFDVDMVKLYETIIKNYADTMLQAGRFGESEGRSSGSSSGFNFGILS